MAQRHGLRKDDLCGLDRALDIASLEWLLYCSEDMASFAADP
jgi:hypothetical protein